MVLKAEWGCGGEALVAGKISEYFHKNNALLCPTFGNLRGSWLWCPLATPLITTSTGESLNFLRLKSKNIASDK